MLDRILSARKSMRVVDFPEFYGGGYDLVTGRRTAVPQMAKSPTAYACMMIRGYELANIPWVIKDKATGEILEKHKLIDMLMDFGKESNYQRGMLYTEVDMGNYGAGLWLRDVDMLKRLNPSTIEVDKTRTGITEFIQDKGQKNEKHYAREDVVYFREYHPEDDLGFGLPMVEVCKKSIRAEVEALLMIEAYFRNDAIPGMYLSTEQDISETQADKFLAWWDKRFKGSRRKGRVGIGGKGLKPIPVGNSMKDSGVLEMLKYSGRDICKAFRVDEMLVGSSSEATYVNLSETRKFFIEDVMLPRAREYQNVINQDLVPQVDDKVVFEFAPEEMPILQENSTQKQVRLIEAYNAGLLDDDYFREEMGYPASAKPKDKPDPGKEAESKWEKKAVKAFQRGESPLVDFVSDDISIDRQFVIKGRLGNVDHDERAIRACFQ